jgi:hypothetical protein
MQGLICPTEAFGRVMKEGRYVLKEGVRGATYAWGLWTLYGFGASSLNLSKLSY